METVQEDAPVAARTDYTQIVANIVSAYVSNNSIRAQELPELIGAVHAAVISLENGAVPAPEAAKVNPAVSIKKSITDEYLVSLEDGKKFKSLKRHLMATYGMTPDDYRAKWGLPKDYPMVAPGYSAQRSNLAKQMGLGNDRAKFKPEGKADEPAKTRGRPRKVAA